MACVRVELNVDTSISVVFVYFASGYNGSSDASDASGANGANGASDASGREWVVLPSCLSHVTSRSASMHE